MDDTPLTLCIHFESDWHVGAGAGQPGHIDRLIRRHPADDLPYLPGKTLTGIWRDACEQVAAGLDDSRDDGPWSAWVDALFGGMDYRPDRDGSTALDSRPRSPPRPALLEVRPGRLSEELRLILVAQPALAEALVFLKPGVRIGNHGVADEANLRFEEVVRAGTDLQAAVRLAPLEAAQGDRALALLWAGAQVVRRLGGKRRRGLGACRWDLEGGPEQSTALALLEQEPGPAPQPQSLELGRFTKEHADDATATWHRIILDLELLSPVIAYDGTVGNVVESRDYIPGTYLLAALNRRLRTLLGERAFASVASAHVRVLNAYPVVGSERGLPVPLAFHHEKEAGGLDKDGPIYNGLEYPNMGGKPQLKQHRGGYVNGGQGTQRPAFYHDEPMAVTHGTIDDRVQRPTADVGGVYTLRALRPGARLRGELWLWGKAPGQDWIDELGGEYRIGKAKKDDYGRVRIRATSAELTTTPSTGCRLDLWLIAPLLLRDSRLRPTTDLEVLQRDLSDRIGVELTLGDRQHVRTDRSEGWHLRWGLPRPSYVGLAPGTCLSFRTAADIDPAKLAALEHSGLGERRAEGFGEVRVNPPLLRVRDFPKVEATDNPPKPKSELMPGQVGPSTDDPFARVLACHAWRAAIGRAALARVADSGFRRDTLGWTGKKPSNSQLGTLRSLVEEPDEQKARQHLLNWFNHLRKVQRRWDNWPSTAQAALRQLVEEPDKVWAWLELDPLDLPVPRDSDVTPLREALRWEAARALWFAAIHTEIRNREQHEED